MASLFEYNGTFITWQLPHLSLPRAILVAAHGCRASGRVWFTDSPQFGHPLRSPLPEESCIASHSLDAGFAVLAPSSAGDCWRAEDFGKVWWAISALRARQPLLSHDLPLFTLGTSSGGWFAGQVARHWQEVAAVSMIVMTLPLADVQPPLPRGSAYPPLLMVHMARDASKSREVQALLEAKWPQRQEVEAHVCAPRPVHPNYFTERLALTANHSRSIQVDLLRLSDSFRVVAANDTHACRLQEALLRAGYLNKETMFVQTHPQRTLWSSVVRSALPKSSSSTARQGLALSSMQVTLDGVFQELDVAYAYHAATCEHIEKTIDFFMRHMHRRTAQPHSKHRSEH